MRGGREWKLSMPNQEKKDVLKELLEHGKQKGQLTTKEINDALEELDFDVERVEKLYDTLESMNVEIVEDFTDEGIEELKNEDLESSLASEGISIDDPVKVYLKEIGRVPLLTPDRKSVV